MAVADTPTLLALDRFARIMGINPVHFNGAGQITLSSGIHSGRVLYPINNGMLNVWPQFSWQAKDQASRDEVAILISQVEDEFREFLGFNVAPQWSEDEDFNFDVDYRREYANSYLDVAGNLKVIQTSLSKFISGGQRGATLISVVTPVYSDVDGDSWEEIATITHNIGTGKNWKEYKIFIHDKDGDAQYEIRPPKDVSYNPITGDITFTFDTWMFIDPELQYEVANNEYVPIDISTILGKVSVEADLYRIYNDTTANHIEINTADGTVYGGYLLQVSENLVKPIPATYDGTHWVAATCNTSCGNPITSMKLHYYSGMEATTQRYKAHFSSLDMGIARLISHMAVARLERVYGGATNTVALANASRQDYAFRSSDGEGINNFNVLDCPFGTKVGEVRAWRALTNLLGPKFRGGTV